MTKCEFYAECPVFEKSVSGMLKKSFSIVYCQGSLLEECARRKLKLAGETVPPDLLPNGSTSRVTQE
jgi:hypothetical protein